MKTLNDYRAVFYRMETVEAYLQNNDCGIIPTQPNIKKELKKKTQKKQKTLSQGRNPLKQGFYYLKRNILEIDFMRDVPSLQPPHVSFRSCGKTLHVCQRTSGSEKRLFL